MCLSLGQTGLSSLTVPATFFIAMAPTPTPLRQPERVTKERIVRAENASANGFDTLGHYAGVVVAANVVF
ncbi:hypothetical protein D7B24_003877 [Verticillium nonalfalfae]|uniref:Uncharacterized protein n=1 Tax=Verticillium nonalfalfae TaxID=1051616 RepID=A0A3M9XXH8_9PEZI|nr:uncharacterized protein D7B24_003877 [Verticillium nonalfalfae]RNJ52326.1 hypothetical protein D7B24_003877 [Verticillium nonalfalfae]